jgi:hypothetical protein
MTTKLRARYEELRNEPIRIEELKSDKRGDAEKQEIGQD